MRAISAGLLIALLGASAARAADLVTPGALVSGYTYYNRPGATLSDHDKAMAGCVRDVGVDTSGLYQQSIAFALVWSGTVASGEASKVESCMIVRGWRVVRLPDAEGDSLADLPQADLARRLEPWIGASQPEGEVVRTWGNELLHPLAMRRPFGFGSISGRQLSFKLYSRGPQRVQPPILSLSITKVNPPWSNRPIAPADLQGAPPGAGVIVVQIKNVTDSTGGVVFAREGATLEARPSAEDHATDFFDAGLLFRHKDGWYAFAVPPGRWRIAGVGGYGVCLGSPAFDLRAGEVVYAGAFDMKGETLGPVVTDLASAKAYIGVGAADRLRPAEYSNGSRSDCHVPGGRIYALELPGAPFEPGYHAGGAPN